MASPESSRLILFDDHRMDLRGEARRCWARSRTLPLLQTFLQQAIETGSSAGIDVEACFRHTASSPEMEQHQQPQHDQQIFLSYILGIAAIISIARKKGCLFAANCPPSTIIAFGPGLLCATVLAAATCIDDVGSIGIEVAHVAARFAKAIAGRTQQNQEDATKSQPWSLSAACPNNVTNIVQKLQDFHRQRNIPQHRQAFVAIDDGDHSTIFGPPSTLALLMTESELSSNCSARYERYSGGCLHASHLPELDEDWILGSTYDLGAKLSPQYEIWSPASCKVYQAQDVRELLRLVLRDNAQSLCRPARTIAECLKNDLFRRTSVDVFALGPCHRLDGIIANLHQGGATLDAIEDDRDLLAEEKYVTDGRRSIAIVGVSGRFPGSESIDSFWRSLYEGRTFHQKVPSDRYNLEAWLKHNGSQTGHSVPVGCFLERAAHFDADFFRMLPAEASRLDPTQRLSLMVAYEALESSGSLNSVSRTASRGSDSADRQRRSTVATFCGQCASDWNEVLKQQPLDAYYLSSVSRAFTSGRINYSLQLDGPAYTLDCACSSSAAAIALACSALRNGECDIGLAGGCNVLASPEPYVGLAQGSYLSPGGPCRPFHREADGYCRGEAVAFVVLKRLEDALRDNDHVLACITGYARTQSQADSVRSIVCSDSDAQARTFRDALADAGLQPSSIGYVEAHGTGTDLGDAAELRALSAVFASHRGSVSDLVVGSVKANIGHTEAASGVSSIIKAIGIQQSGRIPALPASVGLSDADSLLSAAGTRNVRAATQDTPLPTNALHVLVNNPDAAGGNAAFVVSPPPPSSTRLRLAQGNESQAHIGYTVTVSAHSERSFLATISALQSYLQHHQGSDFLRDLAYSLSARRLHHDVRRAWHVETVEELRANLTRAGSEMQRKPPSPPAPGKRISSRQRPGVVFVCGGQGSIIGAAGRDLYEQSAAFRYAVNEYRGICHTLSLPDPIHTITHDLSDHDHHSQLATQLGMAVFELGLVQVWRAYGVEPALVMGHSLGEYTALCVAGILSVTDTLYLVGSRARLMDEQLACAPIESAMLAVAVSAGQMQRLLERWALANLKSTNAIIISCDNGPESCVCAGLRTDVESLRSYVGNIPGVGPVPSKILPLQLGYHSAAVDPILSTYRSICNGIQLHPAKIPFCSTLDARVLGIGESLGQEHLPSQTRGMVNFRKAVLEAANFAASSIPGSLTWLEIGPAASCSYFVTDTLAHENRPGKAFPSCTPTARCCASMSRALAAMYEGGAEIAWHNIYADRKLCPAFLPDLPSYAFNLRPYPIKIDGPRRHSSSPGPSPPLTFTPTAILDELVSLAWETSGNIVAKFNSSLQNPDLKMLIEGHKVSGTAICPMSVLSDLAITAAQYVFSQLKREPHPSDLIIRHMTIERPVKAPIHNQHGSLCLTATTRLPDASQVHIRFETVDTHLTSPRAVAACSIVCCDSRSYAQQSLPSEQSIIERIKTIRDEVQSGHGQMITSPLVYTLFANVVRYAPQFRCMQNVLISESMCEAAATVKLIDHSAENPSYFTWNPYWTDGLTHISGFLANLALFGDVQDRVYIASEVSSIQFSSLPATGVQYDVYVKISPEGSGSTTRFADVYIIHAQKLQAWCIQIKFTALSRRIARGLFAPEAEHKNDPDPEEISGLASASAMFRPADAEQELRNDGRHAAEIVLLALRSSLGIDEAQHIEGATSFSDLGLDSLTSLATVAAVNRTYGLDLPGAFYVQYNSCDSVRAYFGCLHKDQHPTNSSAPDDENIFNQPDGPFAESCSPDDSIGRASSSVPTDTTSETRSDAAEYTCSCVLIHGRKSSGLTPLFFLPDAMGSAISFLQLPLLKGGRCVYALESPFAKDPAAGRGRTVEEFARCYCKTIRQIQPIGPYFIAGYSAGSYFALEVTRQLADAKQQVAGLFIVDMHAPRPHELTSETLVQIAAHGAEVTSLMDLGKARHVVEAHMAMIAETVVGYEGIPLLPKQQPSRILILWATQPNPRARVPPDLESKISPDQLVAFKRTCAWFVDGHAYSGPEGWEKIVGPKVQCVQMSANHLSVLTPPSAVYLVEQFEAVMCCEPEPQL